MRAGVRQCEINPAPGVELGGYPYFERANTGVHDPLVAAALYLDDGQGGRLILLATDLFWITREQTDQIRHGIAGRSDLPADSVLITCSHTHSAPWMSVVFESAPGQPPFETLVDQAYLRQVEESLVQLALDAMANTFEAQLGYGRVTCGAAAGVGGNRRDPENGPVDVDVPVLTVHDSQGDLKAAWTKYALHPTILHGENTLVSADFPGPMRSVFNDRYPGAVFMYSMGTGGDQSPRYFRKGQTFEEVERFGRVLGEAVLRAVEAAHPTTAGGLRLAHRVVDLVVKEYPSPEVVLERVEELRRREAELVAAGAPYTQTQTANLWLLGAECDYNNAVANLDGRLQERYRAGTPYTISALVIGGIAWAFTPGELFCAFGLEIRRSSPYLETNVVTLTNGQLPGYCVTQDALDEGGYEPGNSILAAASGHVMAQAALDLLNELSQGE